MGLNSAWGTGKTTFVKMWKAELEASGYNTIYLNAWENDFEESPLVAIVSELKTLGIGKNDALYKSLLEKGAVLAKSTMPLVIKGAVKSLAAKVIHADQLSEIVDGVVDAGADVLAKEVDRYVGKKKGMSDFKLALARYVNDNCGSKPLVFIVDELDRCKPSYAVSLLEQMKHFFSVSNITFVLVVDKVQLGYAICGAYGSDKINVSEYLRRFIDIECSLPKPSYKDLIRHLFEYFSFDDFFMNEERSRYPDFRNDRSSFLHFVPILVEKAALTLRQIEKLFAHARFSTSLFKTDKYYYPMEFFMLIYIKEYHRDLYSDIRLGRLGAQEFLDRVADAFPQAMREDTDLRAMLTHIEIYLLLMYKSSSMMTGRIQLREKIEGGKDRLLVSSRINKNVATFQAALDDFEEGAGRYGLEPIEHLLDKIDLVESLNVR